MTTAAVTFDAAAHEAALDERGRRLLEQASARGAAEAEVFATRSEVVAVRYEKGDLKLTQVDEGTSIGLRVFTDGKQGFSSTNQTSDAALDRVAGDAATLATLSVADDANVLPAPRPVGRLELVLPGAAAFSIEEAVERARDLVQRTVAVDPRLSLDNASLEVARTSVAVRSTTGVAATESDASVSMQLFGMAVDGDDVGSFDYWGALVRDVAGLDAARDETVHRFTEAALGNLAAGAAASYKGPVLFAPAAFLDVFVDPLLAACSAIAVQRGRSALAEKLGEAVAAPSFTLVDDPTDRALAGAASCDREGQPCGRFPVVGEGVLQSWLYNAYAAAVDGRESTGHAAGGARSVPGLACHAPVVAAGDGGDRDAMIAALGRGLVVQRFSGSVDPASGDFSGVAKSARWVENGRVVRSLRETLISGNAFAVLRSLLALGGESESVMGFARAPWVLVDGVDVTAG